MAKGVILDTCGCDLAIGNDGSVSLVRPCPYHSTAQEAHEENKKVTTDIIKPLLELKLDLTDKGIVFERNKEGKIEHKLVGFTAEDITKLEKLDFKEHVIKKEDGQRLEKKEAEVVTRG